MSGGCFDDFRLGSSWVRMLPSMVHPRSTVTVLFCVRLEAPSVELQILCFLLVSRLLFFGEGGSSFCYLLCGLYFDCIDLLILSEPEGRLFCPVCTAS